MAFASTPIAVSLLGWTQYITAEWLAINLAYLSLTIASRVPGVVRIRTLLGCANVLFVAFGIIVGLWSMVVWNVVLGVLNSEQALRDSRRRGPGQRTESGRQTLRKSDELKSGDRAPCVLVCDIRPPGPRACDLSQRSALDRIEVDPLVDVALTFLVMATADSLRSHKRALPGCGTEVVLVDDGSIKSRDSLSTARSLALMIKDLEPDNGFDLVILVGADNGNFQFTTAIRTAYELDRRVLMNARSVQVEPSGLSITRSSDQGSSRVAVREPTVVGLASAALPEQMIHARAASNSGSPRRLEAV